MDEEVQARIPEALQKSALEAFGEFVEKVSSIGDVDKSLVGKQIPDDGKPRSWFFDPYSSFETAGQHHRPPPGILTDETCRLAAERNVIAAACIGKRVSQVTTFCKPQRNKYSVGFVIQPRGREFPRSLSPADRARISRIERFITDTGIDDESKRDDFTAFMKKMVRDSLTLDRGCFEKVRTYGDDLHSFLAVDAGTIRIANPKDPKGAPLDEQDARRQITHVQVLDGQNRTDYTGRQMAFLVRNPRTHVRVGGYGLPEIEILQRTITSHLWAEEYNTRQFAQGSTVKGLLNLKGKIPPNQLELIRRQWLAQMSGISNAWKTPLINSDGVEFVPLQLTNAEMGFQSWIEYLIKVCASIWNMDPAEIGFDLRGGLQQQPMFMSNNEAQQKVSRDQGLQPLLFFFAEAINRHIVWQLDDRYEFSFVGLDAKTEEQAIQLRMQQVQNIYTLNEVRALENLPPIAGGDIVLNPVYMGMLQAKQNAQLQQQQIAAQAAATGQPMPQIPQSHEDVAFQEPPGQAEKVGAKRLQAAHDEAGSGAEEVSEEEKFVLHRDDWASSVRSAVPGGDLRKAAFDDLASLFSDEKKPPARN